MNDRESQLNAILSRGHGSAQEVIALEMGQWPPTGIKKSLVELPPWPVLFERGDSLDDGNTAMMLAAKIGFGVVDRLEPKIRMSVLTSIFETAPKIVGLSSVLEEFPKVGFSLFGHESVHVLQWMAQTLDLFLIPRKAGETICQSPFYGHGPEIDRLMASVESPEQKANRHARMAAIHENNTSAPELYPFLHNEIQARMHQIIAAASPDWPHLPRTAREAAALFRHILTPSERDKPSRFSVAALEDTRNHLGGVVAKVDLQYRVVAVLPDQTQDEFFEKVIPSIYGSLLELYGDPQGRVKMGLEPSPVHARAMAARILFEAVVPHAPRWPDENWQALAAKVEPQARERLEELARFQKSPALKALESEQEEPLFPRFQRVAPILPQPEIGHVRGQ